MFEVGNIAARLSGIFQDDGFKKFARSYDDSAAKARKPVQAKLGADVDQRGFVDANRQVDAFAARQAQATLSVGDRNAYDKIARVTAAIEILTAEIERGKELDIDTGTAEAKLAILHSRLNSMQRDLAQGQLKGDVEALGLSIEDLGLKAEQAAGGGGAGGGAGGIGALTEAFGPLQGAIAGLAPVLLGLGGSLAALAGSGGAAIGGAGVLGIGSFGALVTGILSVVSVVKPMTTEVKNVDKAMKTYSETVDKFGPKSKEAAAAQKELNKQIKANGGQEIKQVIDRVHQLGQEWKTITQPAQSSAIHLINQTLNTGQQILPSLGRDVNQNVSALSGGITRGINTLVSGGLRGDLRTLSDLFSNNIGTVIHAFADGLLGLGNIARAAAPYVHDLVVDIDNLARGFKQSTDDKSGLRKTVGGLVDQLKSWAGLIGAVGRLLFDFFSSGAKSGQGMVDSLTHIINRWSSWMESVKGSQSLHKFFKDSADITKAFLQVLTPLVGALFTLVRTLMPAWTGALKGLKPEAEATYLIFKALSGLLSKLPLQALGQGVVSAAAPLRQLAGLIGIAVNAVTSLWTASDSLRRKIADTWGSIEDTLKSWLAFFLGMISKVLHAIDTMVQVGEKIPIFGKKFRGLHDDINAATNKIDDWRQSLKNADGQHDRTGKSLGNLASSAEDASQRAHAALSAIGSDLNTTLKGIGAKPVHFSFHDPFAHGQGTAQGLLTQGVGGSAFRYRGGPVGGYSTADDHLVVDMKSGRPKAMISGTEGILTSDQMSEVNGALAFSSMFGFSRFSDLNSLWGGLTVPHHAQGGVIQRANQLDKMHLPYIWGGHHGDSLITNPRPGLDCSSAVSYVLGIPPRVSGRFEKFGEPGPGPISIFANSDHVFMSIFGRGFGTSNENPQGGPGWIDYNSRPGFVVRHVGANWAGIGKINTPRISGPAGGLKSLVQGSVNRATASANKYLNSQLMGFDNPAGQPLQEPLSASVQAVNRVFPLHHTGTPGAMLSSGTIQAIARAKGFRPALAADQIAHGESNRMPGIVEWPPEADGAQGIGLMQLTTGHVDPPVVALINKLGGWGQMRNPVKNMEASSLLLNIGGLARWHGTRFLTAAARGGLLRPFQRGGSLGGRSFFSAPARRPAPKGSRINLNNLTKWAGLPGIPDLDALDSVIGGLQSTYDSQNQFSTLIDGQITPADLVPLINLRSSMVTNLQKEQSLANIASPQLAATLAERQHAQATVEARKSVVDTEIAQIKRQVQKESRRLASVRHNRSAEVMTIASKLAQRTTKLTSAESANLDRISSVDGSFKARLDTLRHQLAGVPRGTGRNNINDRQRTRIRTEISDLEGKRDAALKGLKKNGAGLRSQQAKLRAEVSDKRRQLAKRGFDDAWAFQLKRWKAQDKLAELEKKSKALGASDRAIIKEEGQVTSAQAALDQRTANLPTTITQAILDTLGLQAQAGLPLGGFGGLPTGDATAIAEALGLTPPTGTGGANPLGGPSPDASATTITPDQQALLDQATQLKQIVSSGNFINTQALSVLGSGAPHNPNTVGLQGSGSFASNPLAGMGSAVPTDAQRAVQVIFQSYVPPTPQQAKELGNHVVAGISYQGLVSSPRTVVG